MPETFYTRIAGELGTIKSDTLAAGTESEELRASDWNTVALVAENLQIEIGKKSAPDPGTLWYDLQNSDPTAGGDATGLVSNLSVNKVKGASFGTLTGASDGQAIAWNSSAGEYQPTTISVGGGAQSLQDVILSSPIDNDITISSGNPLILRDGGGSFSPLSIVKTGGTGYALSLTLAGTSGIEMTTDGDTYGRYLSSGISYGPSDVTISVLDAAAGDGGGLTIKAGDSTTSGTGGNLILEPGDGNSGADPGLLRLAGQGGGIDILGGAVSGGGGLAINITGSPAVSGGAGGPINITAGASIGVKGAALNLSAGDCAGAALGGDLVIDAGAGGSGNGSILVGTNNSTAVMQSGSIAGNVAWVHFGSLQVAGTVQFDAGAGAFNYSDSLFEFSGAPFVLQQKENEGFDLTIKGGDEDSGTANAISIQGGGGTAGNTVGGAANLLGGAGSGSAPGGPANVDSGPGGNPGAVTIGTTNAGTISSGASGVTWTHTGDLSLVSDGTAEGGVNKTAGIEIVDGASNVATARFITVDADPDGNVTENTGTLASRTDTGGLYMNVSVGGSGTSWTEIVNGTGTAGTPASLSWSTLSFSEAETPPGTFSQVITVTATGDTFASVGTQTAGAGNDYLVTGTVPAGLSVVVTVLSGATQATVALSGTATAHDAADSVSNAFAVEFVGGAFTGGVAPINGTQKRNLSVNYITQSGGGGLFDTLWHSTVTTNNDNATSALGSQPYLPWSGYTEWPFKNHLKTAEGFSINTGGDGSLIFDSDGYVQDLNGESYARTRLWNAELRSTSYVPTGQYAVLWDGIGTFAYAGDHFGSLDDSTPGRNVITVVDGGAGSGSSNLEIRISNINTSDWPRNIRVVKTSDEASYVAQPFRDEFLDDYKIYRVIRFMLWNLTNQSNMHQTWATRPRVSWATYEDGVPYEVMVSLCHRLNAHPYICLPDQMDQTYMDNFAVSMRDSLDPSLKLYVEVSNEVWNGAFPQQARLASLWLANGGADGGADWKNGARGLGFQSKLLFERIEAAYGAAERAARVRRVVGNQGANFGVLDETWQNNGDLMDKTDAVGVAPYFGHVIVDATDHTYVDGASVATLLADFTSGSGETATSISTAYAYITNHQSLLSTFYPGYSGKIICYEAGPELRNYYGSTTTAVYDKLDAVVDDEGMVQKYKDFLDLVRGGTMNNFVIHFVGTFDRGANNRNERFGSKLYTGQADTESSANIYQAQKEWIVSNPRWFTP